MIQGPGLAAPPSCPPEGKGGGAGATTTTWGGGVPRNPGKSHTKKTKIEHQI